MGYSPERSISAIAVYIDINNTHTVTAPLRSKGPKPFKTIVSITLRSLYLHVTLMFSAYRQSSYITYTTLHSTKYISL